jgi:hypothetical protein
VVEVCDEAARFGELRVAVVSVARERLGIKASENRTRRRVMILRIFVGQRLG